MRMEKKNQAAYRIDRLLNVTEKSWLRPRNQHHYHYYYYYYYLLHKYCFISFRNVKIFRDCRHKTVQHHASLHWSEHNK